MCLASEILRLCPLDISHKEKKELDPNDKTGYTFSVKSQSCSVSAVQQALNQNNQRLYHAQVKHADDPKDEQTSDNPQDSINLDSRP